MAATSMALFTGAIAGGCVGNHGSVGMAGSPRASSQ